jgi:hypothetical protein
VTFFLLNLANLLGFGGGWIAGRWSRWGWGVGLLAEPTWVYWAYLTHDSATQHAIYPWAAIWGVMYLRNFIKWTGRDQGCPTSPVKSDALN